MIFTKLDYSISEQFDLIDKLKDEVYIIVKKADERQSSNPLKTLIFLII